MRTAYHVCSQFLDKSSTVSLSTLLYIASSSRRAIHENANTFIVNTHLLRMKIHREYFYLLKLKSVKCYMSVRFFEHLSSLLGKVKKKNWLASFFQKFYVREGGSYFFLTWKF